MGKIVKLKKRIYLDEDQMDTFIANSYGENFTIRGLEGWSNFYIDTSLGDYDSEKGAMVDYLLSMDSPEGVTYEARAGYYTGSTGHCFNYVIAFEEIVPALTFEDELKALGMDEIPIAKIMELYNKFN